MHSLLISLLTVATILVLLPVLVFSGEVALALLPQARQPDAGPGRAPVAVLVPAHNEAGAVAATVHSILPQLRRGDRLLVVADNCSDDTPAVAAAAGAEVIERRNLEQRGKGFALDFGVQHLAQRAPDVLIIVDADCLVGAGAIDRLAGQCAARGRPIQGRYLMRLPPGAGPLRRIAQFAWLVRNEVRPRGLLRVGLPCQLMGSGMAFPWKHVVGGRLASGHLVEDLKLGLELAAAGSAPLFCPTALVSSVFPASAAGAEGQRRRWEHGHLSVLLSHGPKLLMRALARADVAAFALTMDLLVPPVALLSLLTGAVWLMDLLAAALLGNRVPLLAASVTLGLLMASVLLAWLRFGRDIVSLGTLLLAGAYALGKLPLYVRFIVARQVDWVRSRRDGEGGSPKPR
ncbi:MAG TPA: glycosyltransferase family 2 protein [Steroidobacteraceae bacterium]|jgi:cellulose synthase/poly-beta-1,6-N-acetylglucosamine synthase-like glycosyltransferase|nr:glycosyltransferase family 2 protein [Steroidobacteraceae bacterium]